MYFGGIFFISLYIKQYIEYIIMSEQYIVSARKYRPDSFRSIVGQKAMSQTLQRAVISGKLAHAYLFSGPRGVGKTTAARVLAKTINCFNLTTDGEACNECESCRAFNEQRSFNIFELDAASNNSVEDIRQLTDQVNVPPTLGKYKVYIIDEVHMLSIAAFNAFLKTLEEPPAHALFILATTEKHKILPTILSRCQSYDFKRITVNDIADHLEYIAQKEGVEAERQALEVIAEKADGGMRDALSLFDRIVSFSSGNLTYAEAIENLNILDYSYYIKILNAVTSGNYRDLLLLINEILYKGFDAQLLVSGMSSFMRDLLVVQHTNTAILLEKPKSVSEAYLKVSTSISPANLFAGIQILSDCDQSYREATSKRLHVELAFLRLVSMFSDELTTSLPQKKYANIKAVSPSEKAPSQSKDIAKEKHITTKHNSNYDTPSPQPQAVKKPAIPVPTSGGRIGFLEKIKNENKKKNKSDVLNSEDIGEADFDENILQVSWQRFIQDEIPNDMPVLRGIMSSLLPRKISSTQAEVSVLSETNKSTLLEYLPNITQYLRRSVNNKNLSLTVNVKSVERKFVPMTPKERLKEMIKSNPSVDNMVKTLNLSIV